MSLCVCYHDIAGDVGDLQGQRQHVELTHDLEDQLGVCPRQLQQVEQVRRVTDAHTHIHILGYTHTFWGPNGKKNTKGFDGKMILTFTHFIKQLLCLI